MIKGLTLYSQEEIREILCTIDGLIAGLSKGIYQEDTSPREVCKDTKKKLKDLKCFIENSSDCFNYANKNDIHFY